MALFINDSTDALKVVTDYASRVRSWFLLHLYHKMPSWGASAKTFSLRSHKANSVNYQALYGGYPSEKYSASQASQTLFIIEEIST